MFQVFRLLLLLVAMLLPSCDDAPTGFATPPPRTVSSFRLLSPVQNAAIALAPSDSLQFAWEIPIDIGSVSRYALILDSDDTLANGRILTLELPSVDTIFSRRIAYVRDSTGVFIPRDTTIESVGLQCFLSYQTIANLPSVTPPTDTLFYAVVATNSAGAAFRSADVLRFVLTLQASPRK